MSDEADQKVPDPEGLVNPAAQPLCGCGIRGCPKIAEHTVVVTTKRRRFWRR